MNRFLTLLQIGVLFFSLGNLSTKNSLALADDSIEKNLIEQIANHWLDGTSPLSRSTGQWLDGTNPITEQGIQSFNLAANGLWRNGSDEWLKAVSGQSSKGIYSSGPTSPDSWNPGTAPLRNQDQDGWIGGTDPLSRSVSTPALDYTPPDTN